MCLYKYTSESRIEDILVKNQLRFTQPCFFNDLFDVNPSIEKLNLKSILRNLVGQEKEKLVNSFFDMLIKYNYRDKSFNTESNKKAFLLGINQLSNEEVISAISDVVYEEINTSIGILSLTEEFDNILMWAHYTDYHKGFVIEFNSEIEYLGQPHKVIYNPDNKRPSLELNIINPEITFLTKSKEWEYENEYRIIRKLENADEIKGDNYLFKFPKNLINSIYCGCNMKISDKGKIIKIIKEDEELKHIKVYDMKISDKYYKLDPIQIL